MVTRISIGRTISQKDTFSNFSFFEMFVFFGVGEGLEASWKLIHSKRRSWKTLRVLDVTQTNTERVSQVSGSSQSVTHEVPVLTNTTFPTHDNLALGKSLSVFAKSPLVPIFLFLRKTVKTSDSGGPYLPES